MILVDANILVYSHVKSLAQHEPARDWLDRQLNGSTRVGLPWASLLAFLRLVTNSRIFERPETMLDAWRQVRRWLVFNRPGYRNQQSATLISWASCSRCPGCMATLYPMLIWPRLRSSMD